MKFFSSLPFACHVLMCEQCVDLQNISKDNFIEDILLCLLSYRINTLIIAAVRKKNI